MVPLMLGFSDRWAALALRRAANKSVAAFDGEVGAEARFDRAADFGGSIHIDVREYGPRWDGQKLRWHLWLVANWLRAHRDAKLVFATC